MSSSLFISASRCSAACARQAPSSLIAPGGRGSARAIGLALRYRMGMGTLLRLLRGHSDTIRHQYRR
jgi:hypothetical protein